MPTEVLLLAGTLVLAGAYITYQHSLIVRYRRTLALATMALEAVLFDVIGDEDEDTDS